MSKISRYKNEDALRVVMDEIEGAVTSQTKREVNDGIEKKRPLGLKQCL